MDTWERCATDGGDTLMARARMAVLGGGRWRSWGFSELRCVGLRGEVKMSLGWLVVGRKETLLLGLSR